MLILLLYSIAIIFFTLQIKNFSIKKRLLIIFSFIFVFAIVFTIISYKFSEEEPIISNITKTYKIENRITKDREFAFFYTQTKLIIFQKDKENYKKIYYTWDNSNFNLDKDLFLVYNRVERKKLGWVFLFPFQNTNKFCGIVKGE